MEGAIIITATITKQGKEGEMSFNSDFDLYQTIECLEQMLHLLKTYSAPINTYLS